GQQLGETDQAGRIRTRELPTPPRPMPALRRPTRLDPPTHDPTLKRGEPGKAVGAVEAKPPGAPLAGGEPQSAKYAAGLPKDLPALVSPLPFLYESTGDETMFTDGFDPEPRSRPVVTFHRPETLARWLRHWIDDVEAGSLRARLHRLGPVPA